MPVNIYMVDLHDFLADLQSLIINTCLEITLEIKRLKF